MRAFNDAIEKLLWPEKRAGVNSIWITTESSYLRIPEQFVPELLRPSCKNGFLDIGPIPKGTPINLLANVEPDLKSVVTLLPAANRAMAKAAGKQLDFFHLAPASANDDDMKGVVAALMAASKCPDLIEDRGHYFGVSLSDSDKRALIEFLKTL